MDLKRPKFTSILLLRCPHCMKEGLRKPGSWFEYRDGCEECGYKYEREQGYFTGAPWMVNYSFASLLCFYLYFKFMEVFPEAHYMIQAVSIAIAGVLFSLFFYPFARAIWMFVDHLIHPLTEKDKLI